jgi:hypothetical protein
MNNFQPPIAGERIAEYKESLSKILGLFIAAPLALFICLFFTDSSENWIKFISYGAIAFLILFLLFRITHFEYRHKLYLLEDGLSINDKKIPFYENGLKNIEFFRQDGDRIYFKCNKSIYNRAIEGSIDNMGFLIDPRFQNHKQELLVFLNSQIQKV